MKIYLNYHKQIYATTFLFYIIILIFDDRQIKRRENIRRKTKNRETEHKNACAKAYVFDIIYGHGVLAQLVERYTGSVEVSSSNLLCSTKAAEGCILHSSAVFDCV